MGRQLIRDGVLLVVSSTSIYSSLRTVPGGLFICGPTARCKRPKGVLLVATEGRRLLYRRAYSVTLTDRPTGLILCHAALTGPYLGRYRSNPDETFTVEKLRVAAFQRCPICRNPIDIRRDTDETNPKSKFRRAGSDGGPLLRCPPSGPDQARRNFDSRFVSSVSPAISIG